jgi:hypothetical protein
MMPSPAPSTLLPSAFASAGLPQVPWKDAPLSVPIVSGMRFIPSTYTLYAGCRGSIARALNLPQVFSNAGRPEASYCIERIIDIAAREIVSTPSNCAGAT